MSGRAMLEAEQQMLDAEGDSSQGEEIPRELLARRPSYRKILNDLSGTSEAAENAMNKIHEEGNTDDDRDSNSATIFQVMPISGEGNSSGVQTLTMSNGNAVQYSAADGQFLIPASTYQLATGQLFSGAAGTSVLMASAAAGGMSEEAHRKRELRLLKNKEAAKECRRKKKEYVKCLENRVAVLENQNKALIEELKSLKELYCEKAEMDSLGGR